MNPPLKQGIKMKRPYVNLNSENIVSELLGALNESLDKFTNLKGVVGIILDGGLSRGYGDFLSEIDVVIYLNQTSFLEYKEGRCPFALGITMIDGYLYDIKLANYQEELKRELDFVEQWDLSYAKILYDPEGKMADYISKKISPPVDISRASGLLWSAYWSYKLAGDIWIHRQDILQGHYVFNSAIKPLISALFIANKEYIPHDKWLVHMSRSLLWKPDDWDALLLGAMNTGDFSLQSLINRQQCMEKLWNEINHKLCVMSNFYNQLDFVQKSNYESLIKLITKEEYTIDEWLSVESLESLNYEPFHSLFQRVGDRIIFNKNRLLSLKPDDMYMWMYQIANEVRKKLCTH